MKACPQCHQPNQEHYKFCLECGAVLDQSAPAARDRRVARSPEGEADSPLAAAPPRSEWTATRGTLMRAQLRCPGCGCRKILHVTEILDSTSTGRERLALAQPSRWSGRRVGELEALVCTECRLVEWYAKDLEGLEVDGEKVRLLDGEAAGPYR